MKQSSRKKALFAVILILTVVAFISQTARAQNAPRIATDKDSYDYGEKIKVSYFNAPGYAQDWICIVPEGSPDTEGGDYQYIPENLNQGTVTFETPAPGKYEARAYYDYAKKGYMISARSRFTITGNATYEKKMAQTVPQMERPLNPQIPLETNIASGNALIYIFRESWRATDLLKVQILSNDKDLIIMPDASYYAYSVPAGSIKLSSGSYTVPDNPREASIWLKPNGEITLNVKAGHAYYVKIRVVMIGTYGVLVDQIPHEEAAAQIAGSNYILLK